MTDSNENKQIIASSASPAAMPATPSSSDINHIFFKIFQYVITTSADRVRTEVFYNRRDVVSSKNKEFICQEVVKLVTDKNIRRYILNLNHTQLELTGRDILFAFTMEEKNTLLVIIALHEWLQNEMVKLKGNMLLNDLTKTDLFFSVKLRIERKYPLSIYFFKNQPSEFSNQLNFHITEIKNRIAADPGYRRYYSGNIRLINGKLPTITDFEICLFWYFQWFLKTCYPGQTSEELFIQENKKFGYQKYKEITQQLQLYFLVLYFLELKSPEKIAAFVAKVKENKLSEATLNDFYDFIFKFLRRVAGIEKEMEFLIKRIIKEEIYKPIDFSSNEQGFKQLLESIFFASKTLS